MAAFPGNFGHAKKAAEAIPAFRFVNILAADDSQCELPDAQADNDYADGISMFNAALGENLDVATDGAFKLEVGEAVAYGDLLAPGAAGVGMKAIVGNKPRARALGSATKAGVRVPVRLIDHPAV